MQKWLNYGLKLVDFDWRVHSLWDWVKLGSKEFILVRWIPANQNGLHEFPMEWRIKKDLEHSQTLMVNFLNSINNQPIRKVKSKFI